MDSARQISEEERQSILRQVEELGPWFHNYQIAGGIWTNPYGRGPGANYPGSRWEFVRPLLPDVKGKSCLDVGCSSGFFSLKLKELGASYVLGIDDGEQPKAIQQARFAAATLCLDVEFRKYSVYDLAQIGRQFDLVLFLGVFYHLRHPMVALDAIRAVCRQTLIIQTITTGKRRIDELDSSITQNISLRSPALHDERFPMLKFLEGPLDQDPSCWFVPNLQAVTAMLRAAGFTPEKTAFPDDPEVVMRCRTR
jgi:tRNA (mo5U34)-methyltransferase